MIPVTKDQVIDPYDTSTIRISSNLFFFRRYFVDEFNAEIKLCSYDFSKRKDKISLLLH